MIFEEDLKDFVDTFRNSLTKFKEFQQTQSEAKKYSVEKIRETHQQAYQPWTQEDDEKLELLFCEGKKVKELAHIFARKEGAITSRIKKLELKKNIDDKTTHTLKKRQLTRYWLYGGETTSIEHFCKIEHQ